MKERKWQTFWKESSPSRLTPVDVFAFVHINMALCHASEWHCMLRLSREWLPGSQPNKYTYADFYQFAAAADRNISVVAYSHQFITLQE